MKKIALFASFLVGLGFVANAGARAGMYDNVVSTVVTVTSGQVFTGNGWVHGFQLSTGTTGSEYAVAYDTTALDTSASVALLEAWRVTPAMVFTSSATNVSQVNATSYGVNGFRVTKGLYIRKSNAASGEANRLGVLYSK